MNRRGTQRCDGIAFFQEHPSVIIFTAHNVRYTSNSNGAPEIKACTKTRITDVHIFVESPWPPEGRYTVHQLCQSGFSNTYWISEGAGVTRLSLLCSYLSCIVPSSIGRRSSARAYIFLNARTPIWNQVKLSQLVSTYRYICRVSQDKMAIVF